MKTQILPIDFSQFDESIYAGFWWRLLAVILDAVIIGLIGFALSFLHRLGGTVAYIVSVFQFFFYILYQVLFTKLYGATPGKFVVGLVIVKMDGTPVGWWEASMRNFVTFCIAILGQYLGFLAMKSMDSSEFQSLGYMDQMAGPKAGFPGLAMIGGAVAWIWFLSDLITFLFSPRHRALHDLIGETLVIKDKFRRQILEIMADENVDTDS